MTYEVQLAARAAKDLDRLPKDTHKRILARLEELAVDPYGRRASAKLKGKSNLRKSRVGGWRIIFTVDDEMHAVLVVTVERRGQAYRRI